MTERFKIYYELSDGSEDSIVLEANTIEELREILDAELAKRNAVYSYSEELT